MVRRSIGILGVVLALSSLPTAKAEPARVYVVVVDGNGQPITGLSSRHFLLRVDGVEPPILGVRPATDPPALVVIVDGYTDFYTLQMRRALRGVLNVLRAVAPEAHVGFMMSEGSTPPALKHVTRDAAALDREAASFLQRGASAPMLESIGVAARVLSEAGPRRLILLLTSQRDSIASSGSAEVTGEAVRRSGASLWALQSTLPMTQSGVVENEKVLKTVTRASGGRREQRLTWLIEEHAIAMTRQMLSQYEVTFELAENGGPGYLRVGVDRQGVEVFAPGWTTLR